MTAPGSVAPEPLLERGDELAAVRELVADAVAARGRLLLVEAPAGLGKSAVLERAPAIAEAGGMLVLRAGGHELERGLGWGVARSLIERWVLARPAAEREELLAGPAAPSRALLEPVEDTDGGLAASEVSFRILHGLHWLIVRIAERRPVLLVVDDAHWADEPSLRFVLYLLGRLHEQPIALLVAARGEPGEGRLLEQVVANPATTVRVLRPLGEAAVADLVRRRVAGAGDRFCRRCLELTGGNPLQVRELVSEIGVDGAVDLDGSVERAARSLSRSVLRRLGVLSGDAQAVARAVAVFETDVELHLAAALAERVPASALAAVDELARADILAAADPLRFVHPLLRAAVYGALPRHERGAIHRRAARLLAAQGATSEQVAVHLLEAAPVADPEAVEALRRAAGSAMAHGVPASAIRYLERAIREPPADDLRPQLLAELARAELAVGRRDAIAHLEAAIELAGDSSDRARFRLELGRALHDFGRPDEACAALERGAAELDGGDRDLVVDLESWYLTSAMVVPERAADAHRRAQAIISRADRAATRAERALVSKAMIMHVYSGGTCEQVASIARQLFAGGRLLEEDGVASQALGHVAGTLSYCDRYADVEDVLARTLEHCRRRGLVTWVAMSLQLRARQRLWTGSLPDAVEDARIAFETLAGGLQMYLPATGYCLARGLIEQDHPDEAAQVLAAVDAGPPPRSHFAAWRHEAAGRLAAHRADHERALESFLAAGDCLRGVRVTNPAMFHWRSEAGLAALRLDRRDLARALIDEELELAERFGAPRAIGVARRASGLLERGETAVATLRSAAEALEACGARVEHARALAELGAGVRRAGRPGEARTALREAIRLAEELGARTVARQARDELKRAGGRAPAERDAAGDLTPGERRVAELAAAGRSNREIANELFVTVKAVEWHLGNVYRKLDVRGRGELAGAL